MNDANLDTLVNDIGDPVKILVIEDNIDDQNLLKRQLSKSGVRDRVMCIGDGSIALNLIRGGTRKLSAVAAVFLDLSLPGVNGLLLLQAIRANVETALLPVFVVTGSINPKDETEAKRLGATSFIAKDRLALPEFRETLSELLHAPISEAVRNIPDKSS